MELQPIINGVIADLEGLAALGDEQGAEMARRWGDALGRVLRLRLYELLGQVALEVAASLPSGTVEVRLVGQEPTLVVTDAPAEPTAPADTEEMTARISLRLTPALKSAVERAAEREDVSVNAWLVRALKRAVDRDAPFTFGRRLSGFGHS